MESPEDNMLSIPEVAESLRITRQRVWQLVRRGKLVASPIGGPRRKIWVVKKDDLTKFLEERAAWQKEQQERMIKFDYEDMPPQTQGDSTAPTA